MSLQTNKTTKVMKITQKKPLRKQEEERRGKKMKKKQKKTWTKNQKQKQHNSTQTQPNTITITKSEYLITCICSETSKPLSHSEPRKKWKERKRDGEGERMREKEKEREREREREVERCKGWKITLTEFQVWYLVKSVCVSLSPTLLKLCRKNIVSMEEKNRGRGRESKNSMLDTKDSFVVYMPSDLLQVYPWIRGRRSLRGGMKESSFGLFASVFSLHHRILFVSFSSLFSLFLPLSLSLSLSLSLTIFSLLNSDYPRTNRAILAITQYTSHSERTPVSLCLSILSSLSLSLSHSCKVHWLSSFREFPQ